MLKIKETIKKIPFFQYKEQSKDYVKAESEEKKNDNIEWTKIGELEWSKELGLMNWYDAIDEAKVLGERLPTKKEQREAFEKYPEECKKFFAVGFYWSSTETSGTTAFTQSSINGQQDDYLKDNINYVRCVRNINNNESPETQNNKDRRGANGYQEHSDQTQTMSLKLNNKDKGDNRK